jgi:hypothetical protein
MRIFSLLLLLASHQRAHAFSGGSGACFGGNNNLFGPHLSSFFNTALVVTKGSLSDGGLSIFLDDQELTTGQVLPFTVGIDYNLRVVGSQAYKGILIRLQASQGVDTSNALLEDSDLLGPANVCTAPVVGINHNSAVLKNNQGGTIRLDEPSDVFLDITIVNVLDDTKSEFYYSRLALRADLVSEKPTSSPSISSQPTTTQFPSVAPSEAPSDTPSVFPSLAPSVRPSASPSDTQSVSPSSGPSLIPSTTPSDSPSGISSIGPSKNPSIEPSDAPSLKPSAGPSGSPSDAPSTVPSGAPSAVPSAVPSNVPSQIPSRAPTKQPSLAPSPGPTLRPTRAPTDLPSQSPTKSSQPSIFCVAVGDTCHTGDTCCGEGANVCVGVCTRAISQSSKDLDSSQYKLSDGARDRGSGSVRRKLLKGSGANSN